MVLENRRTCVRNQVKPTGGKHGHIGRTLGRVQNPDEVIEMKPEKCECGCDLSDVEGTCRTRQVVEIPVIKAKVTEHRAYEKVCPNCKRVHKTEFLKM